MTSNEVGIGPERPGMQRFLAYALPRDDRDTRRIIHELKDFNLHDVPLGDSDSFLDFDGVVLMAGAFETIKTEDYDYPLMLESPPPDVRFQEGDLDRREREFATIWKRKTPFVFLVPDIPREIDGYTLQKNTDLFRRVLAKMPINWGNLRDTAADLESEIPEFQAFVATHGSARVYFEFSDSRTDRATIIVGRGDVFAGFAVGSSLFFLPCHKPETHDQAVRIAESAIRCVLEYRRRMSTEMPEWASEFPFDREIELRKEVDQHRSELVRLEDELAKYSRWKRALCSQSGQLAHIVVQILKSVFELRIDSEEKFIDDGQVLDGHGETIAVVEIKGPKGNFGSNDVNQVKWHRERLSLQPATPGLLIMNTFWNAKSLAEKDHEPNTEIIALAVHENVLLVRTLDLLRYANLVETGARSKAEFLATILRESGWLKVQDGSATIVQK